MTGDGKDIDALIASVFKSKDGEKLLSYLDERFIRQAVCNPGRYFQSCIKRQEKGDY